MKAADIDLLAILVLTVLMHVLIYSSSVEFARVSLGLVFVLFFPGYALVSALYPSRSHMNGIERVALSVGLSLALVPLLGLALNFTPWGIRLTPIVVTLSLWTLVVVGLAWIQRRRVTPEERFEVPWAVIVAWFRKPRAPLEMTTGLVLTLAALAVLGAVAWKAQQPVPGDSFTEFYVLGAQKMLKDYPTRLRVEEVQDYNVGVVNNEKDTVAYVVRAFLDDTEVGSIGPLTLNDGEKWEGKINVFPATAGEGQRLELRLYRTPEKEVYRTLHLFVDVAK